MPNQSRSAMIPPSARPKRAPTQWVVWALVAVVLLVGVVVTLQRRNSSAGADNAPELQTASVSRGRLTQSVSATGRVVPNFEVEIKGKASGKIIKLPFDVSDTVRAGDLLVELDPLDESRSVSQANATLVVLEERIQQSRLNFQVAQQNMATNLDRAQADLLAAQSKAQDAATKRKRLEALVANRYISQDEYETGVLAAVQADAALVNAKVRLQELKTQDVSLKAQAQDVAIARAEAQGQAVALAASQQRLSETRILAPISGVITSRAGQIGQIVSSGISNVGGGTAIMTVADLSRIFILASVDESDIGLVRLNQPVHITVDAFPAKTFTGQVIRIAPKGVEEANVVTFEVKIEVSGADKALLKPEMTANIEIMVDHRDKALLVPSESVITRNGRTYVQVPARSALSKGEAATRETAVTLGISNGTDTEVLSGLQVGDRVVVGQKSVQSQWKKDGSASGKGAKKAQQGQMMMMRGMRH
jgi:HlyD family secretion protein